MLDLTAVLAVYAVCGMYMFKASAKPEANKTFIGFWIWGALGIHFVVLVFTVLFDDTPVFEGTETVFGFTLPQRVWGIAHWPNITPVGDVPLLLIFMVGDAFLASKAFGSMLLPWEDF